MDIFDINTSSIVTMLSGIGIGNSDLRCRRPFQLCQRHHHAGYQTIQENDHVKINDVEGKIKKIRLTTTDCLHLITSAF
jgi:hypothetical protein